MNFKKIIVSMLLAILLFFSFFNTTANVVYAADLFDNGEDKTIEDTIEKDERRII